MNDVGAEERDQRRRMQSPLPAKGPPWSSGREKVETSREASCTGRARASGWASAPAEVIPGDTPPGPAQPGSLGGASGLTLGAGPRPFPAPSTAGCALRVLRDRGGSSPQDSRFANETLATLGQGEPGAAVDFRARTR